MVKIEKYWKKWRKNNSDKDWNLLLEEIWKTYYPKLCVYIDSVSKSDLTDDRASDILVKVFDKIKTYNPEYRFSTWIYAIARNYLTDLCRISARLYYADEGVIPQIPDKTVDIEGDYIRREDLLAVERAIETLMPDEKELVYLRYYEKLKYSEIAEVTGMPVGTVKNRVYLLRKKIMGVV